MKWKKHLEISFKISKISIKVTVPPIFYQFFFKLNAESSDMKTVQVFFILSLAVLASGIFEWYIWVKIAKFQTFSAEQKCSVEPKDCRYGADGQLIKDLSFLVAYIPGLSCKNGKSSNIVTIDGAQYLCCNPVEGKNKWRIFSKCNSDKTFYFQNDKTSFHPNKRLL
jgi:hypothetical protein